MTRKQLLLFLLDFTVSAFLLAFSFGATVVLFVGSTSLPGEETSALVSLEVFTLAFGLIWLYYFLRQNLYKSHAITLGVALAAALLLIHLTFLWRYVVLFPYVLITISVVHVLYNRHILRIISKGEIAVALLLAVIITNFFVLPRLEIWHIPDEKIALTFTACFTYLTFWIFFLWRKKWMKSIPRWITLTALTGFLVISLLLMEEADMGNLFVPITAALILLDRLAAPFTRRIEAEIYDANKSVGQRFPTLHQRRLRAALSSTQPAAVSPLFASVYGRMMKLVYWPPVRYLFFPTRIREAMASLVLQVSVFFGPYFALQQRSEVLEDKLPYLRALPFFYRDERLDLLAFFIQPLLRFSIAAEIAVLFVYITAILLRRRFNFVGLLFQILVWGATVWWAFYYIPALLSEISV